MSLSDSKAALFGKGPMPSGQRTAPQAQSKTLQSAQAGKLIQPAIICGPDGRPVSKGISNFIYVNFL